MINTVRQDSLIGQQIEDFIIQERIGLGTTSNVYRAFQISESRDVAIKIMYINATQNTEQLKSVFVRDVKRIAALKHLHILPIYSYGFAQNNLVYVAMSMIEGGTLEDYLHTQKLTDMNIVVHLITQIARGVGYAHARGVVHRDLKPSSIFVDDDTNAFVSDFGIGRSLMIGETLTSRDNLTGVPVFMSPEELHGYDVDRRSNVYNLGAILYRMASGHTPYDDLSGSMMERTQHLLNHPPTSPRTFNPNIPPTLEDVILKAMAKSPDDRYDNANEFETAVQAAVGGLYQTIEIDRISEQSVVRVSVSEEDIDELEQSINPLNRSINISVVALTTLIIVSAVGFFYWFAPVPQPTIIRGSSTNADALSVTGDVIARAQRHVRNEGFVAYLSCDGTSPIQVTQAERFSQSLESLELEVRLYDSLGSVERELQMLDIAQRAGATLIVACLLPDTQAVDALAEAELRDVHTVLFDEAHLDEVQGVAIVSADYLLGYLVGLSAGDELLDRGLGEGRVVILDYPNHMGRPQRADGFEDGLAEIAPNVQILGRYLGDREEDGYESLNGVLERGVTIHSVLSVTDEGAYGAVSALIDNSISPIETVVYSIGGGELAYQYINGGVYMKGTIQADVDKRTDAAVNATLLLLGGGTLTEYITVEPGSLYTGEFALP